MFFLSMAETAMTAKAIYDENELRKFGIGHELTVNCQTRFAAEMGEQKAHSIHWIECAKYYYHPNDILRMIAVVSGGRASLPAFYRSKIVLTHDVERIFGAHGKYYAQTLYRSNDTEPEYSRVMFQAKTFKVCSFRRGDRRVILEFLNAFPVEILYPEMKRYRAIWIKIGEKLHPGEYQKTYRHIARIFEVLRKKNTHGIRAVPIETLNAKIEKYLSNSDYRHILNELSSHPEDLARRICTLLSHNTKNATVFQKDNASPNENQRHFQTSVPHLLKQFISGMLGNSKNHDTEKDTTYSPWDGDLWHQIIFMITTCSTLRLAILYRYLAWRSTNPRVRSFQSFNENHSRYYQEDTRLPLSARPLNELRNAIVQELWQRFSKERHFETCIIDEELKTIPLTAAFIEKSSQTTKSVAVFPVGSRLRATDAANRFAVYWCENPNGNRVDIDLSVIFFDDRYDKLSVCACCPIDDEHAPQYRDLSGNSVCYAKHSGDRASAPYPNGACEYVDIDCQTARRAGVRYVLGVLMSAYSINRRDLNACHIAVSNSARDASKPQQSHTCRLEIERNIQCLLPAVWDLEENALIQIDLPLKREQFGNIGELAKSKILSSLLKKAVLYSRNTPILSTFDYACLQAAARCKNVLLRRREGIIWLKRREDESVSDFFQRLISGHGDASFETLQHNSNAPRTPQLAFLLTHDGAWHPESDVHELLPH